MKKFRDAASLIRNSEFTTKALVYMSTKAAGEDYDPYEQNYTHTTLNPKTIKCYVHHSSPEGLIARQYGLHNIGAIEILTEDKYETLFENCERVTVEGVDYQVFRQAPGTRAVIQRRAGGLLRVLLQRKD